MESRMYSAQEMREMACMFFPEDEDDVYGDLVVADCTDYGIHINKRANSDVREMLLYAAGVVERHALAKAGGESEVKDGK